MAESTVDDHRFNAQRSLRLFAHDLPGAVLSITPSGLLLNARVGRISGFSTAAIPYSHVNARTFCDDVARFATHHSTPMLVWTTGEPDHTIKAECVGGRGVSTPPAHRQPTV